MKDRGSLIGPTSWQFCYNFVATLSVLARDGEKNRDAAELICLNFSQGGHLVKRYSFLNFSE